MRVDSKRQQIKIARKRLQQSDADFRRITIETISQVQQTYWDLVFALRDQQNRVANVDLAKEKSCARSKRRYRLEFLHRWKEPK